MEIFTINGVVLPAPSSHSITSSDIDSSGTVRNEVGVLMRDRIRSDVYQIDLEFKNRAGHEVALVESAIKSSSFEVRFPDSTGFITKKMHTTGKSKGLVTYNNDRPDDSRWNLTVSLTEY